MSLVFVDANILIYLVEDHAEFASRVAFLLERMRIRGDILCTSTLVVAEIIAGARLMGDENLEQTYSDLFTTLPWRLLPFAQSTVRYFVDARAMSGVRAPDAVHLACAAEAGVAVFLTHDLALTRLHMPGIGFIVDLSTDIFGRATEPGLRPE